MRVMYKYAERNLFHKQMNYFTNNNLLLRFLLLHDDFLQPAREPQCAALQDLISSLTAGR